MIKAKKMQEIQFFVLGKVSDGLSKVYIYLFMVFIIQTAITEQSGDSIRELDWPPSFSATYVIKL